MSTEEPPKKRRLDLQHHLGWFPLIAASLAGLWALYSFFYQERIREEESTAYLVIESTLQNMGEKGDLVAIQATINITNPSTSKAYVLADYFNVRGTRVVATEKTDEDYLQAAARKLEEKSYTYLSRFTQIDEHKTVFSGKVFDWPDVWWLEPAERLTGERIFYVPKSFDFLTMTVVLYYCRDAEVLEGTIYVNPEDLSISHKIRLHDSGQEFDWHNSEHLALQKIHRNAEITHEVNLVL
jgi:hypothetical protein